MSTEPLRGQRACGATVFCLQNGGIKTDRQGNPEHKPLPSGRKICGRVSAVWRIPLALWAQNMWASRGACPGAARAFMGRQCEGPEERLARHPVLGETDLLNACFARSKPFFAKDTRCVPKKKIPFWRRFLRPLPSTVPGAFPSTLRTLNHRGAPRTHMATHSEPASSANQEVSEALRMLETDKRPSDHPTSWNSRTFPHGMLHFLFPAGSAGLCEH